MGQCLYGTLEREFIQGFSVGLTHPWQRLSGEFGNCFARFSKVRSMLSVAFFDALQSGTLRQLREAVTSDPSLCPEIRDDILTIYYRGGSLLQISRLPTGEFQSVLTEEYLDLEEGRNWFGIKVEELRNLDVVEGVIPRRVRSIPILKALMDEYFDRVRSMREKEFQQQIVIANNHCYGDVNTDYFFCDMEFANQNQRFDLVGVRWPATGPARRNNQDLHLCVGEVKFGTSAIPNGNGQSGLVGHFQNFLSFLQDNGQLNIFRTEVLGRFNQKQKLGFIPASPDSITSFADRHPDYLVMLGDCNPRSAILRREIDKLNELYRTACENGQYTGRILVPKSHFLGQGLWERGMVELTEFVTTLSEKNYPE